MNFRRFRPYRLISQLAVVLLMASPLAGFSFFQGTLAAADISSLPMADPLAALQVMLATGIAVPGFILSAAGVTFFYFLLGGRFFCSWVCPVYLLTEMTDRLRKTEGTGENLLPLETKIWMLALFMAGSVLSGLPFFETVSPISMFGRAVAFGSYSGILVIAGVLLFELFFARRVWCRSLCPLGGFYSLVGRHSGLRISYLPDRCTQCGECTNVCPVEEVLQPCLDGKASMVLSGDCTRCADCLDACQENALKITYRFLR